MTTATIYDAVPYHSVARTASYVDRLSAIGRLLGLPAADADRCRVLELGCGDGGNILPMAVSLPHSEFVGIDLAPSAIERGNAAAREIGVTNATLLARDIADIGAELGAFDYVIAHGVYSWVPAPVRAVLLRVIREHMRPNGVAFVSYNALPGDHIRGVVRQMMRMHTAGIADPRKKLEQARALLQLLAKAPGDAGDVYRPLLQSEIGRALQASDDLLFHDDLADISQPFFFTEFMAAAQDSGLQFLAEANFHSMSIKQLPDDIAAMLGELGSRDLIAKEQYLDFLTCRGFRQTLLCHGEASLNREINLERMEQFRFVSEAQRESSDAGEVAFRHRNGSALRTDHPLAVRAMETLLTANPRSVSFLELADASGCEDPSERELLADVLLQTFTAGVTELRLHEPTSMCAAVSDRPTASAWARHVAHTGRATNLYHEVIELDEPARQLLPLADGTRTAAELAYATGLDVDVVARSLGEVAALALLTA